jgi:hypothetical protein
MFKLRKRMLAAMGFAGCAAAPASSPVDRVAVVDASVEAPLETKDASSVAFDDASSSDADSSVLATSAVVDADAPRTNDASVASAPPVDAGAPKIARVDAGPPPRRPPPPWTVSYPLPPDGTGMAHWCTKEGTAVCMLAQDVNTAPIRGNGGGPDIRDNFGQGARHQSQPMSQAVAGCPVAREIECPCHNPVRGCSDQISLTQREPVCTEPLMIYISRAQRQVGHANACCYQQEVDCGRPGEGRPLRVHDGSHGARVARSIERTDWIGDVDGARDVDRDSHEWLESAALEHASIASFAILSLELMALGAPADLVRRAHEAALDEIRHAASAYALASKSSQRYGPASLAMPSRNAPSLASVAVESLVDGGFGETAAAVSLAARAERAARAGHAKLARVLAQMAEDETRHAELAFAIVAWAAKKGGAPVIAALRDASASLPAHDVTREVVRPCVDALAA